MEQVSNDRLGAMPRGGPLTMVTGGRTYYRTGPNEGWRRLRDAPDYDRLNRMLDAYREMVGADGIEPSSPAPKAGA